MAPIAALPHNDSTPRDRSVIRLTKSRATLRRALRLYNATLPRIGFWEGHPESDSRPRPLNRSLQLITDLAHEPHPALLPGASLRLL